MELRGFSRNRDETDWLKKHGLPDKAIYQAGRGAEDLDECLASFRGRPGQLVIARDLRAFGETKREVAATMARLEKVNIQVLDISHPEDTTIAEMMHRASVAISGYRFRNRKTARRRGREGGLCGGIAALESRARIPVDSLIRNIVRETDIDWQTKARVTGISKATLRRHYMPKPRPKKVAKKRRRKMWGR